MDLLFSYKGGDELMNNVLLYFALKHDGDFEKIYNDIKRYRRRIWIGKMNLLN